MSPKNTLTTLKKRPAFLAVAATGQRWVAPGFILQVGAAPAPDSPSPENVRHGLTASKKVGNAVKRNRSRRRLRALAREVLAPHADPARAYVLIARGATETESYTAMKNDLIKGLKRFKLYREA